MKAIKLFFALIISATILQSCSQEYYLGPPQISLENLLSGYEIWYVDYNRTQGTGDVPFMSMAFTMSFRNGQMYANNNLVNIGSTGNGFGVITGYYNTFDPIVQIDHLIDGAYDFEVIQVSDNQIKLYNRFENVTYFLEGYQRSTFDYDKVFYDNIEYFLQEYFGWEKTYRSTSGIVNPFDNENYLGFTPENITTFYSSEDPLGLNIQEVYWDYTGGYEVFDVLGYDNLKILTLDYDLGYNEEFELVVLDDGTIELYNVDLNVVYEFSGRDFLPFLKDGTTKKDDKTVSIEGRKRTKVNRKTKVRKKHLK